jgi:hypothetical protein
VAKIARSNHLEYALSVGAACRTGKQRPVGRTQYKSSANLKVDIQRWVARILQSPKIRTIVRIPAKKALSNK